MWSQNSAVGALQFLLKHGADVNAQRVNLSTLLYLVADQMLARMLVDHGANVNAVDIQGQTPLHRVLEGKHYFNENRSGVAQLLVKRGADVNARDEDNKTPLHLASCLMEPKLVRMLLDQGADVNAEEAGPHCTEF